jgi:hypothetical protein
MIAVDQQLVAQALTCITDRQSSHYVRELIFGYQLAVNLHNRQWGRHVVYEDKYERELRDLVAGQG